MEILAFVVVMPFNLSPKFVLPRHLFILALEHLLYFYLLVAIFFDSCYRLVTAPRGACPPTSRLDQFSNSSKCDEKMLGLLR